MQYNKQKHFELLINSKKLENARKMLSEEELRKLTKLKRDKNFFELLEYSGMMISHLHWENRQHYYTLIEKYLNAGSSFIELLEKSKAIEDAGKKLQSELILLEPNPKSDGFSELIDEIIELFEHFCPEEDITESYELSEKEVKKILQNLFIEMKDRYP